MTAHRYAAHGANLLCINRNREKSEALRTEIERDYGVQCEFIVADLSRLADTRRAADALVSRDTPIDVLIHNAGVYLTQREVTPDGIEKVFAVHHLASFLINYRVMDKLKKQDRARIITVSSEGHRFAAWGLHVEDLNWEKRRYTGLQSYGAAKTAQLLAMLIFAEQCQGTGVTLNAMHPGAVKTETGKDNGPVYRWLKRHFLDKGLKSPDISAEALYYLGVSKDVESVNGRFFHLTTLEDPAPPALDREVAEILWQKSLALCGLKPAGTE